MKRNVAPLFAALVMLMGLSVSSAEAAALLSEQKLAQIVQRAERSGKVSSAEVVQTTAAAVLELNPYYVPNMSAATQKFAHYTVQLAVLHGPHFVDGLAKRIPGSPPDEGETEAFSVDPASGQFGLVSLPPVGDLSHLGAVEHYAANPLSTSGRRPEI